MEDLLAVIHDALENGRTIFNVQGHDFPLVALLGPTIGATNYAVILALKGFYVTTKKIIRIDVFNWFTQLDSEERAGQYFNSFCILTTPFCPWHSTTLDLNVQRFAVDKLLYVPVSERSNVVTLCHGLVGQYVSEVRSEVVEVLCAPQCTARR